MSDHPSLDMLHNSPRVAVVVPVFGHSSLVHEAVLSLAGQDCDEFVFILVEDGCPDPQTFLSLCAMPTVLNNCIYVRKRNGGLSAARNTGINYIMNNVPTVEGIYFLDADNFLEPYSVRAMIRMLERYPEADWFYPDINMFGISSQHDYGGVFRKFVLAMVNICEAGSLIRRRVFEHGLRFDEEMKGGYEDWDFWLNCVSHGFVGMHAPELGLSYRKRPESMLAGSHRNDGLIRLHLAKKYPNIYNINYLNSIEHVELPRWTEIDCSEVRRFTDPLLFPKVMSHQEWGSAFRLSLHEPAYEHSGGYVLLVHDSAAGLFKETRSKRWFLGECERHLDSVQAVTLRYQKSDDDCFALDHRDDGILIAVAFSLASLRHLMNQSLSSEIISALEIKSLRYLIPKTIDDNLSEIEQDWFLLLLNIIKECCIYKDAPPRFVREFGVPPLYDVYNHYKKWFGGGVIPLCAEAKLGRIVFVTPICDFGGVERVTVCIAGELRRAGYEVDLIVLGRPSVRRFAKITNVFNQIYLFDNCNMGTWDGPLYFGTPISRAGENSLRPSLLNLLSTYQVCISEHSSETLEMFSELRSRGVITMTHLHVFDKTNVGRVVGHPVLALAYEHATGYALTCSETLAHELAALGIPRQKILGIPNAPSFRPSPSQREQLLKDRATKSDGALNIIFLGRLDSQKGVNALVRIRNSFSEGDNVNFRFYGKVVLTTEEIDKRDCNFNPPVYEDAELAEIYKWADVLLLPSRYEGLPLTVLEAMAFGVTPIATDCGALAEACDDQIDGFLIQLDSVVEGTVAAIRQLMEAPERLKAMQLRGMQRSMSRSWASACQPLLRVLEPVWKIMDERFDV